MAQAPDEPTPEEVKERTATIVRRIGYVVFMGGGLLLFIPMLIAVASGIKDDRIWDPFSGERVHRSERVVNCQEQARRLLVEAGEVQKLTADWDQPYRVWLTRCREDHPQMYDMLRETRRDLRRR
jgi:lipopolysaccharide/colanic/teichoic acid biosynthesis glycosyltransferase